MVESGCVGRDMQQIRLLKTSRRAVIYKGIVLISMHMLVFVKEYFMAHTIFSFCICKIWDLGGCSVKLQHDGIGGSKGVWVFCVCVRKCVCEHTALKIILDDFFHYYICIYSLFINS